MKKQERNENGNKGFSLVELIVVVAIMAVLLVVLTPQYLRYVERTRLQKDNTAIGELAQAIKLSLADENVMTNTTFPVDLDFSVDATTKNQYVEFDPASTDLLEKELAATIGDKYTTASNAYKDPTSGLSIQVTETNGIITVTVDDGWMDAVGDTAGTKKPTF